MTSWSSLPGRALSAGSRLRWGWLPIGVGGLALAALIYFDLGPNLPFNDDWSYAWQARHVGPGGIPRVAVQAAHGFVQAVWGYVLTLGHANQYQALRLSLVPVVLLAVYGMYQLSRALGASQFWSGMAAMVMISGPLFLNVATSFMTEVPYVALLLMASSAGTRWVQRGEQQTRAVAWSILAVLQRQTAVALPVALTAMLVLGYRRRRPARSEWIHLGILWLVSAIVVLSVRSVSPIQEGDVTGLLRLNIAIPVRDLTYVAPVLGLCLMPFAAALLLHRSPPSKHVPMVAVAAAILGIFGLGGIAFHLLVGQDLFPGNIWTQAGAVITNPGPKPFVYPDIVWGSIEALAVLTFVVLLIARPRLWAAQALGVGGAFVVLVAVGHAAEASVISLVDRHLLPTAVLLMPLAASAASNTRWPKVAAGWALGVSVAFIGLYAVGQQDYEAWQAARDQAARVAYSQAPPESVYAGFEPNAIYYLLPLYDTQGHVDDLKQQEFPWTGPSNPRLVLVFASPDDPRQGVTYSSVAPGRIVIANPSGP